MNNFYKKLCELTAQSIANSQVPIKTVNANAGSDYGLHNSDYGNYNAVSFVPSALSRGPPPLASAAPIVPLSDDNLGHQLLVGMGWNEGTGLGADNSGIVEPIREVGKKDKSGVGSGLDPPDIRGDFASYRNKLSSDYHIKITEREADRYI